MKAPKGLNNLYKFNSNNVNSNNSNNNEDYLKKKMSN